jgi:hypothetical protein
MGKTLASTIHKYDLDEIAVGNIISLGKRGWVTIVNFGMAGTLGPPAGPANFCSRMFFSWVSPLLQRGSTRQLHQDDMFHLEPDLEPSHCSQVLWNEWTKVGRAIGSEQ